MNINANYMFYGMTKLSHIDINTINTSRMISAQYLFVKTSELKSIDLSNFDTSNMVGMSGMFEQTGFVSLDLSSFNTSNVTIMQFMFSSNKNLQSITFGSNFNMNNVGSISHMFNYCPKITSLDLSSLDLSKVTNTTNLLHSMNSLQTLKTPKAYPTDSSLKITLPTTFYDSNGNAYTELDNTSPTNTVLFKSNGVNPSQPIIDAYYSDDNTKYVSGTWTNKEVFTKISAIAINSTIVSIPYTFNKTYWYNGRSMSENINPAWKIERWSVWDGRVDTSYFKAIDANGNESVLSEPFTIMYDISAPVVNADNIRVGNTLNINITDTYSGVAAWQITTSDTTPTTDWITLDNSKNIDVSKNGLKEGTYYIWAKDVAGNIGSKQITVS